MPEKWDHPEGALELLEGNVQIQQTRTKKHVTLWTRKTTAEGAGKPIVKQIFAECAKETRNEPDVEVRHQIMSDCMKQHKEEMGTPGLRVRESRGKFTEEVNGRPGLKGTFLVNGIENGTRINEVDARLIRSGQEIPGITPKEMQSVKKPTYIEMNPEVEETEKKPAPTAEVDPEVKALLCEYEEPLNRYLAAIESKQFGDAVIIEEEMRDISDCVICNGIIDEVVEAAENMDNCEGENCAKLLDVLRFRVKRAKEKLCPEHKAV